MDSCDLHSKRCRPCSGGTKPFGNGEIGVYLSKVSGWELLDGVKIVKKKKFKDFKELMAYVDKMAEIAETEGHHPDFSVSYNRLTITLTTHAIKGLSENDFIMAAKLDKLS